MDSDDIAYVANILRELGFAEELDSIIPEVQNLSLQLTRESNVITVNPSSVERTDSVEQENQNEREHSSMDDNKESEPPSSSNQSTINNEVERPREPITTSSNSYYPRSTVQTTNNEEVHRRERPVSTTHCTNTYVPRMCSRHAQDIVSNPLGRPDNIFAELLDPRHQPVDIMARGGVENFMRMLPIPNIPRRNRDPVVTAICLNPMALYGPDPIDSEEETSFTPEGSPPRSQPQPMLGIPVSAIRAHRQRAAMHQNRQPNFVPNADPVMARFEEMFRLLDISPSPENVEPVPITMAFCIIILMILNRDNLPAII